MVSDNSEPVVCCTGEMPIRRFRRIIIAMWVLLAGDKTNANNKTTQSFKFHLFLDVLTRRF